MGKIEMAQTYQPSWNLQKLYLFTLWNLYKPTKSIQLRRRSLNVIKLETITERQT